MALGLQQVREHVPPTLPGLLTPAMQTPTYLQTRSVAVAHSSYGEVVLERHLLYEQGCLGRLQGTFIAVFDISLLPQNCAPTHSWDAKIAAFDDLRQSVAVSEPDPTILEPTTLILPLRSIQCKILIPPNPSRGSLQRSSAAGTSLHLKVLASSG